MTHDLVLYAGVGCGSAPIEALLELAGASYRRVEAAPWEGGPDADALRALNPLVQVPTLVIDGTVVTESAAIVLLLADLYADAELAPRELPARASFYRWITFLAVEVYGPIAVGDHPEHWVPEEACTALRAGADERIRVAWRIFEAAVTPAPYLLGSELTALDVYAATLSRWRPRRDWLRAECPKITTAVELTEQHPVVAAVTARNFP